MFEIYELCENKKTSAILGEISYDIGAKKYDIFAKNTTFALKIRALREIKTCAIPGEIS